MGDELQPGQSQEGGSGQGQEPTQNNGNEYGSDEFLRDLIADGIVDGKDQERGATPPTQSAKGTEPGAEPQQEKPEEAKPTEQPTQEGKPTEDAAAQPQPGDELSPEERWRREAQSEKDKRYAAEQERERLIEQLNTRQQSDTFAQLENQHIQFTQPQRDLVNSLYEQWKSASDNGDTDVANVLARQWSAANQTLQVMDWQYTQGLEGRKKAVESQKQEQHRKVVDRQLKEDFDTSIEELKKVKPDLNPFDPFSLQKAVSLVLKERHKAELEKERKDAQRFRDEARDKWLAENPGSQADKSGSATGAARKDAIDFSGMSIDAILEESLAGITAPKRR